jgi:WD40 repeat protein
MFRCMGIVVAIWLPAAAQAQTQSALDRLDAAAIPVEEHFAGQPKELVAILGTNRGRHSEPICSLVYSPDGKYLAAGGSHGKLHIWHAESLGEHAVLAAHNRDVTAVACAPDGKVWATASWEPGPDFGPAAEGYLRLWDRASGKQLATLGGHQGVIGVLSFAPDGNRLASGSDDRSVRVWDLNVNPPRLHAEIQLQAPVCTGVFSPDGKSVITLDSLARLQLWDADTAKEIPLPAAFAGNRAEVREISGNGAVAVAYVGEAVEVWDWKAASFTFRTRLKPRCSVERLAISYDGQAMAICDDRATVHIWDLKGEPKEQGTIVKQGQELFKVAVASGGKLFSFTTAENSHGVTQWDFSRPTPRDSALPPGPLRPLAALAWSSDGAVIALEPEGKLWLWHWDGQGFKDSPTWSVKSEPNESRQCKLAFTQDARTLGVVLESSVHVFDMTVRPPSVKFAFTQGIARPSLAFSPTSKEFAVAAAGLPPQVFGIRAGRPKRLQQLPVEWEDFAEMVFAPDGKAIAIQTRSDGFCLWDLAAKKKRWSVNEKRLAETLSFSPNGQSLAIGRSNGVAELWEVASGKLRATWKASDGGRIRSIAFSPDGKRLATLAYNEITVWAWGQKQWSVRLPAISQAGVVWGPDSRHFAVANANGTVYILRVPSGQ